MAEGKGRKQTVYVPKLLAERLEKVKDKINISQVCVAALDEAVSRIEREEAEALFRSKAVEYARDPAAIAELRRTGQIKMPSTLETMMRSYHPAQREGAYSGWTAGTADVFQVLRASEQPILPFEYNPPKGGKSES